MLHLLRTTLAITLAYGIVHAVGSLLELVIAGKNLIRIEVGVALASLIFARWQAVLVAESKNDGGDGEPWIPPTFVIWYRIGGWPIGFLGWIENWQFHGTSCYGLNDFPFDGRTI